MTMIKLRSALVLPLVAALAAACSKTPEPTATTAPEPQATSKPAAPAQPAPAPAAGGQQAAGGELAWDAPASFESAPNPNAMRKATYKIKRAEGDNEDAELSVSQAGGSVDANITRWIGQFSEQSGDPKRSELKVNDVKVTVVEVKGTFASGMPGMGATTPKPSYAMLGAIAETPSGELWFFKLTGPEKTVTAARADFDKLVNSLRVK